MKLRLGLINRFLAGGTTLLVVSVIIYMTGWATADAAALSTETPSGPAGSSVLVTGAGYLPLASVGICWDEPGCSDLGSAQPGLQTDFSTEVRIPGSASPGEYRIHACQLLAAGLTCSSASFEVLGAEPVTTTTTPVTTTIAPPTTTTSPTPSTTNASTTPLTEPATTTTQAAFEGDLPPNVVETVEATTVESGSGLDSEAASDAPEQSTTTTIPPDDPQDVGIYTPPTLSTPDLSQTPGGEERPTIVVEATTEVPAPLSWLDDPVLFWAAWLVALVVGSTLASMAAWLIRRRQREN